MYILWKVGKSDYMKSIVGILLTVFIALSFFGTTTYAETKPLSITN